MMGDSLATKDNGVAISASVPGMGNIGMKFADNSLVCDAEGSCMLKDNLETMVLAGGAEGRKDSAGNVMITDRLATKDNMSFNVGIDGVGNFGMKTADNYLRCDASGSCMMGDKLTGSDRRTWGPTDQLFAVTQQGQPLQQNMVVAKEAAIRQHIAGVFDRL
jgi:hypothetical protein